MLNLLYILLVIVLIVFYVLYVGIIKRKNKVQESWSDIDVQLKKRYDLIPNMVEVAKKYMEHESSVLEEVTRIRSQIVSNPAQSEAKIPEKERLVQETLLGSSLQKFMMKVENYPDLKANKTMLDLQQTLTEVEEHIAAARRFYNSNVTELNNVTKIFPGNMVAGIIGLKPVDYFTAENEAKEPQKISMT